MSNADHAAEQAWQDHCDAQFQGDLDAANDRIKRLEDIIEKASEHFRSAGPNAFTAYEMADVLKEAKP